MAKSHDGVWLDIVTKDPRGEVDAVDAQVKDGTPTQTLFANSRLFGIWKITFVKLDQVFFRIPF